MNKAITLAITGASGMPYAVFLLKELLMRNYLVNLIFSKAGIITFHHELSVSLSSSPRLIKKTLLAHLQLEVHFNNLEVYGNHDWYAPIASGSSVNEAMVICPCSMATLAKVANGIADDLIIRAADVIIKERKNLIIVPRETPLSAIHLENMLKLAKLGVAIIPPMPSFYNEPLTISDIVNFGVSKILDQLNISNNLTKRW